MLTTKLAHLSLGAAGTRIPVSSAFSLSPSRYGFSPKVDGTFVYMTTDRAGRIATMLHRSGCPVTQLEADGLYGQPIGLPDAALSGELEAHTEAGIRARETRGYACLHMIDAVRMAGRSLAALPAADRYARLHRWQATAECYSPDLARSDWWSEDDQGKAHDPVTGRYVVAKPRDLRRLPIIPILRGPRAARGLWDQVDAGLLEGIVAVRLDAPLGARGAKRKVRPSEDLDVTVVTAGKGAAMVAWKGVSFAISAVGKSLRVGDVWSCRVDGWYESSITPKFARLVARRDDLSPAVSPAC